MSINAPIAATGCLFSTIRNLLPRTAYFDFIPPYGKRLACGEEVTVWGDIQHHFTKLTANDRRMRSFQNALRNKHIALVKTPAVHLFDTTFDETKILTLDSGSVVLADPCWGEYSSSAAPLC